MSFTNKIVIVTGASSGIGINIAELFAKEGAKLTISGRDAERLRKTAEKCEKLGAEKPLEIVADLAKENEVESIISKTVERYGQIDILVNNAAIFIFKSIMDDNFLPNFDKHIAVNVKAPLILMKLAAPHLISTKGNIVNISSVAAISPVSTGAAYGGSKAALDFAGKCIALDLASKGVRVNSIILGQVLTPDKEKQVPEALRATFKTKLASVIPMQKTAVGEEVADLVAFVASDKAKSITGVGYIIDNGITLKGLSSVMSIRENAIGN